MSLAFLLLLCAPEEEHMDFRNSYEGIDGYAVKTILIKARRLVGKAGFTENDVQDIEQDLAMHLLENMYKYNPETASW